MSAPPVVVARTGLASATHGTVARRLLGLVQFCGLCGDDFCAVATCGGLVFSGATCSVCVDASGFGAKGVVAVLCLQNRDAAQTLLAVAANGGARHSAALCRDDVLVAPEGTRLHFGGTRGAEHVSAYFVVKFRPQACPEPARACFAVSAPAVETSYDGARKTEILSILGELAK
uniref:Pox protein n=1 Tax=Rousettus bat poxvirus TaxID=3141933 RepID=A0AAU7E2G8_9POXV